MFYFSILIPFHVNCCKIEKQFENRGADTDGVIDFFCKKDVARIACY